MKISVVIIGAVCMVSGIIMANLAISNMTVAAKAEADARRKGQMFSSGDVIDPISTDAARTKAVAKYQETQPDGPLIKRMRMGQFLTVAGFLVAAIGSFI